MAEHERERSQDDVAGERARPGASATGPASRQQSIQCVLDASALLVLLFAEPGADTVADVIAEGAAISTVNLAEVATVLVRQEHDAENVLRPVRQQVVVESFTAVDALSAAAVYPRASRSGLSLGDRACLALAERLKVVAVTAVRAWMRLDVGVEIRFIRPAKSKE